MTASSMPGYDPNFFGADLSRLGPFGDAAADASAAIGKIASGLTASPVVDYAYKCGQGKTVYRCYAIGKYSNAILVSLQHQINRLAGRKAIAEDGILGPATFANFAAVAPAAFIAGGVAMTVMPTTLDQLAAAAPQMGTLLKTAADAKLGAEPLGTQIDALLGAMKSAVSTTADEVAHDQATGAVPAGFTQNSVKTSAAGIAAIAKEFGPAAAQAAQQIDVTPQSKSNVKLMVAVGVGLTVVAAGVITAIALSGRKSSGRRRAA
jgi:hypothetical protein